MTKLTSPEYEKSPAHDGSDFSKPAFDVILQKLNALYRSSTLIDLFSRGVSFFGILFYLNFPSALYNFLGILPMAVLCFFWYMKKREYALQIWTVENEIVSLVLSQERQLPQSELSWGDVFVNSENLLRLKISGMTIIAHKIEPLIWFLVSFVIFAFHARDLFLVSQ